MKKAIVLMLAVILSLSLAVPAAAAGTSSPKAATVSGTTTAPLPEVVEENVKAEDGTEVIIETLAADDTKLAEEEKATLAEAQTALAKAAPAGMKAQYFFFVKVIAKDDATKKVGPVTLTLKVDNVTKVVVKQFVDGAWVELKAALNADGTVSVEGVVDGPIAIFTK